MTISPNKLMDFLKAIENQPVAQRVEVYKPAPDLEEFTATIKAGDNGYGDLLYSLDVYNNKAGDYAVRILAGNTAIDIADKIVRTSQDVSTLKNVSQNLFGHAEAIRHNLQDYPDIGGHGRKVKIAFSQTASTARTKVSSLRQPAPAA